MQTRSYGSLKLRHSFPHETLRLKRRNSSTLYSLTLAGIRNRSPRFTQFYARPERTLTMYSKSNWLSEQPLQNSNDCNNYSIPKSLVIGSQHNYYDGCNNYSETMHPPEEAFVRELFLQKLPSNVRMVLASVKRDTTLPELAQMADEIVEVATPSVSAVTHDPPHLTTEMEQLRSDVASLTNLVKSLTRRRRSPSPNPTRRQSTTDLCWYHQRFGDAARKCQEPCSKSGNATASH